MSSRIKRQTRPHKFTEKKITAMKGRSALSANKRAKTGKAKVTLAKAPSANEGPK